MADLVGRAWYELGTKDEQLDKDLREAEAKIKGSGQRGAADFEKSYSGAARSVGASFQKAAAFAAGIGIAIGTTQLVSFLADSVTAASDLAETTSKVEVVFGDAAAAVRQMGETSADALGMSENAALSAAGTYGNLFRAMGLTEEVSADMSVNLVKLAADLASFNNMDPTEVLDKLRAGLSGETEPLRTLGVNLNEARIKAKALEMGLWNGNDALTAAAKAQATYALILDDTALAQGDFDRTSDGLANTQRILAAEVEDLSASIGESLLPYVLDLTVALKDALQGLGDFGDAVRDFLTTTGDLPAAERLQEQAREFDETFTTSRERAEENQRLTEAANNASSNSWIAMGQILVGSTRETTSAVETEWTETGEAVPLTIAEMKSAIVAILADQKSWQDAVNAYPQFLEDNLMPETEVKLLTGQIEHFTAELVKAQKSGDEEWIAEVEGVLRILNARLSAGGLKAAKAFADGFGGEASMAYARGKAERLANTVGGYFQGESPPPEGPLSTIDIGGYRVGKAWADGFTKGIDVRGMASGVAQPSGVGGFGTGMPMSVTVNYNARYSFASAAEREEFRREIGQAASEAFARSGQLPRAPLPNY